MNWFAWFKLFELLRLADDPVRSFAAIRSAYHVSQLAWFPMEIITLKNKSPLPKNSLLIALNPFLDGHELLRVGGRLEQRPLSYDVKHPIILYAKSILVGLLIRHVHEKYFHASQEFVHGFIRSKIWLINGGIAQVKKAIKRCVWHVLMKAQTIEQLMGNLLADWTKIACLFMVSSVDFAGPFTVKCTNNRTTKYLKHYAVFFVYMVTRAAHIESVADLTPKAFLTALQRFAARRGVPRIIWSDNATNFVVAHNELKRHPVGSEFEWKFIPARSLHHGGVWEAVVKVGKGLLLAGTRGAVFFEDDFKTMLAGVEAIMNSRPLYAKGIKHDSGMIEVLKPGHFLVGDHILNPRAPDASSKVNSLFDMLGDQPQKILSFWQRWKMGYLSTLQSRTKWQASRPNIKVIKERTNPCCWPLGRIVGGRPDKAGRLRIVTVASKGTEVRRAVQQLVKLPVQDSNQEL